MSTLTDLLTDGDVSRVRPALGRINLDYAPGLPTVSDVVDTLASAGCEPHISTPHLTSVATLIVRGHWNQAADLLTTLWQVWGPDSQSLAAYARRQGIRPDRLGQIKCPECRCNFGGSRRWQHLIGSQTCHEDRWEREWSQRD